MLAMFLFWLFIGRKEKKMHFDMIATGNRIRKARKEAKITQEKLAEELNISRIHLAHIEIGHKAPSIDLLIDLAEYFNKALDYLVRGIEVNYESIQPIAKKN